MTLRTSALYRGQPRDHQKHNPICLLSAALDRMQGLKYAHSHLCDAALLT